MIQSGAAALLSLGETDRLMIELGIAQPRRPEVRSDVTKTIIEALTTAAAGNAVRTWPAGAVEIAASQ